MSTLFTATVIEKEPVEYSVHNEEDVYVFVPSDNAAGKTFRIKRMNDQWHVDGQLDEIAKQQAVSQLERYLLQQH